MLLRLGACRRLFTPAPLDSFKADGRMFEMPNGMRASRPHQGLDMRKVNNGSFCNPFKGVQRIKGGYQWGDWALPSVEAPNKDEIVAFFDCQQYGHKYTPWQLTKMAMAEIRFILTVAGSLAAPIIPLASLVFWLQTKEPLEQQMDFDEFIENYRYNYYGGHLDHHGFNNYLEARRANKWRDADIDVKEMIPPTLRG